MVQISYSGQYWFHGQRGSVTTVSQHLTFIGFGKNEAEVLESIKERYAADELKPVMDTLTAHTIYNCRADWEAIFGPVKDPAIRFKDSP